tara:strand:- start:2464 stop:3069 length:606 start_codon:yes stop_codon:yes gene_type:complete
MDKKTAEELYYTEKYEEIVKMYSITYNEMELNNRAGISGDNFKKSRYINNFKKSFINYKLGKPIISKDNCLGEREFLALLSLCNCIRTNKILMDKLPSAQMTIIDKLPYDEQLNILRKLYGMPAVKIPVSVKEPRAVESVAVVVRKETELKYIIVCPKDVRKYGEGVAKSIALKRALLQKHRGISADEQQTDDPFLASLML